MVIRMGKGIGKVELGMTLPQVRRALGGPHFSVYGRLDFGARGRYLELGWEFPGRTAWEPVIWQVGFRSTSRRGPLRVTRVATTAARERTPQGLGLGSRPLQLARAYRNATCVSRFGAIPHTGLWVVVSGARGMTAFQIGERGRNRGGWSPHFVVQVMVQRDWFAKGPGHEPCSPGWERR